MPYTEAPLFGRTRNAWAADRTSGGSSGGAAVALAAGVCPIGVGTDAGGSTRIPAACNGVVGFKQSAGVVPHDTAPEAFANISSINPMARTVMDTALMLEAMAGHHPSDPYSYGAPSTGFVAAAKPEGSLKGMRIAWRPLLANTMIDSEVLEACETAAMALGQLGASVEPMDDDMQPVEPIWFAYSSAMWNARFRDLLPKWGNKLSPTLVRQMELGKNTTGEAVGRALLARTQLYRKVQGWFDRFDVIAMPTLTRTAIPIEERLFEPIEIEGRKADSVRKAWYPYTHPFNLTGHPAITLPCGFHSDGLPMAIQLVGRRSEDARLLRVAALFEQARPWAGEAAEDRGGGLEHPERQLGLVGHAVLVPGRVEGELHADLADAGHGGDRVLDPRRHLAGDRAARRRQRHLDGDVALVVDVDLVDQAQLVDVGGDLRIVHGLQGRDDVGGELLQLLRRDRRSWLRRGPHRGRLGRHYIR